MLVLVKLKICLFQEKFLYIHYLVKNDNIPSSVEFQDLRQRRETKTNNFFYLYRTCLIISIIERQDKDIKQTLIFFHSIKERHIYSKL